MDSVDLQVLRSARQWLAEGHRAMLGVVVRTWGSAPRPVGAMLAIRDDAHVVGSVSGGCVEDDLIERCRHDLPGADAPSVVRYGVTAEQAARFGLPCGGSLQIVLQPLGPAPRDLDWLDALLNAIAEHRCVRRELDLRSGAVRLLPAGRDDQTDFDGHVLRTVHGPRWRLLLIGAGQVSRYLAEMARALDYQVQVCDPRSEYAGEWQVAGSELHAGYPDDFVLAQQPDAHTAVIALTHDPKLDDAALIEALKSPAFYVGALGSRRNNDARRARLALFELSTAQIARLHGPVGLAIGSRTPPEIAVAILAELTAVRHGVAPILQGAQRLPEPQEPHGPRVAIEPAAGCGVRP